MLSHLFWALLPRHSGSSIYLAAVKMLLCGSWLCRVSILWYVLFVFERMVFSYANVLKGGVYLCVTLHFNFSFKGRL